MRWPSSDLGTALKRACRLAGIKEIRVHDLRHTFASQLRLKGIPLEDIQELLGHSDLPMTLRYAKISPEKKKRAADCALAMQREMKTIVNDWASEGAGHLRMRIGLHQGEAIVGNFGSDKRSDYTTIGPTVNLAARIESAGEPGHVFLSSELSELLPKDVAQDAGSFELKGIEGERRLYKLVSN